MSDRIDHAAAAREGMVGFARLSQGDGANQLAAAQVHATLALAEQQRVANLIALEQYRDWPSGNLLPDVKEALGL